MSANPFDLDRRRSGGKARAAAPAPAMTSVVPARVWTAEEQAEKLSGYLEVPREHWEGVRYGTHVRYFTEADGFRAGGFVQKNPFEYRPKGATEDARGMRLQNGFDPRGRGYAAWFVNYKTITRLYLKPDASVLVLIASLEIAVRGLNDNIRKLAEHQKKMEARLAALEAPDG